MSDSNAKITNPYTGKKITIGGKTFKDVLNRNEYTFDDFKAVFLPINNQINTKIDINTSVDPSAVTFNDFEPSQLIPQILDIQSPSPYDYIVHLADIHIPLNLHSRRKDEYQTVFNNLYQHLESLPTGKFIIIIVGDILDTKLKLEAETVQLTRDFLCKLANIAPTIVTIGNHDFAENNPERMDNISAICDRTPVISLKTTGIYQAGTLNLVFNSLYDQQFIRYNDVPDNLKNKPICCLYHGTVVGSVNCNNTENSASRMKPYPSPSDFHGFDMTLLGHIHKRQFLSSSIAYCGSLLQKNFGESIDEHGFILWDLHRKTGQTIDVYNPYVRLNLNVYHGQITDEGQSLLDRYADRYLHLKLYNQHTDTSQLELLRLALEHKYHIITVQFPRSSSNLNLNLNHLNDSNGRKLYNSLAEEETLIRKFANSSLTNKILEYHQQLYQNQHIDDNTWYPLEMNWSNLFSYGGSKINTVNFKQGVTNICAPNTAGKTSLVHILNLALFNTVDTSSSGKNFILNRRSTNGSVNLTFIHNGQTYLIEKTISSSGIGRSDQIKTNFYRIDSDKDNGSDNCRILLNGSSQPKTIDTIRKFVGKLDEFTKTNMITNGIAGLSVRDFGSTDIIKFFENLFNIERFEQNYAMKCKKERKLLDKQYREKAERVKLIGEELHSVNIEQLTQTVNSHHGNLTETNTRLETLVEQSSNLKKRKIEYDRQYTNLTENIEKLNISDTINEETSDLRLRLRQLCPNVNLVTEAEQYNVFSLENLITREKRQLQNEAEPTHIEELKSKIDSLESKVSAEITSPFDKSKIESEYAVCQHQRTILSESRESTINRINELEQKLKQSKSKSKSKSKSNSDSNLDLNLKPELEKQALVLRHELDKKGYLDLDLDLDKSQMELEAELKLEDSTMDTDSNLNNLTLRIATLEHQLNDLYHLGIDTSICISVSELEKQRQEIVHIGKPYTLPINWKTRYSELENKLTLNSPPDYHDYLISENQSEWYVKMPLKLFQKYYATDSYHQFQKDKEELDSLKDKLNHNLQIETNTRQNQQARKFNEKLDLQIRGVQYQELDRQKNDLAKQVAVLKKSEQLAELKKAQMEIRELAKLEAQLVAIETKLVYSQYRDSQIKLTRIDTELAELAEHSQRLNESLQSIDRQEQLEKLRAELSAEIHIKQHNKQISLNIQYYQQLLETVYILQKKQYYRYLIDRQECIKQSNYLASEISKLNREILILEQTRQELRDNWLKYSDKLANLKIKQSDFDSFTLELEELRDKLAVYDEYIRLMAKDGVITNYVLESFVRQVIEQADHIASKYLKYNIGYEFHNGQKLRIFLLDKGNREEISLNRLSGYECAIFMIAMCRAMGKVSFNKSDIFIIDERLDCFDRDKFEEYLPSIFDMLKENFRTILFISHRDVPSDVVDSKINIVTKYPFSYID